MGMPSQAKKLTTTICLSSLQTLHHASKPQRFHYALSTKEGYKVLSTLPVHIIGHSGEFKYMSGHLAVV